MCTSQPRDRPAWLTLTTRTEGLFTIGLHSKIYTIRETYTVRLTIDLHNKGDLYTDRNARTNWAKQPLEDNFEAPYHRATCGTLKSR